MDYKKQVCKFARVGYDKKGNLGSLCALKECAFVLKEMPAGITCPVTKSFEV